MIDDAELLEAWAHGNAAAGQALAARHYDRVLRFFEFRVRHHAEDLAQRTFLACVESRASFRHEGSFKAYLFGIARRQLAMQRRTGERDDAIVRFSEAAGEKTRTTQTGVISLKEEQRLVLRAFTALSDEQKTVIELFYWERMSLAEVGQVLHLSTSAVTSRLHRARSAIRTFIEQLELRPSTRESLVENLEDWTRSVSSTS